jgi:E3 ubiquitin-protein ligase ZNF598
MSSQPLETHMSSVSLQDMTPQEQARHSRHTSVLQRASTLLNGDNTKMSTFRAQVSSYRSFNINATELIESFFSIFDVPSAELGKLVRELADIYEDDTRRQGVLKAWNDWLSINADYPSLPGPSTVLPDAGRGDGETRPGGRRVLRLKSSTAKSSRSNVSRQGSWGGAADSTSTNTNTNNNADPAQTSSAFPALGGGGGSGQKKPVWSMGITQPSATSTSSATNNRYLPPPRPPTTTGTRANDEMFPALPMGQKPNTLMAGLTRGAVRWDDGSSKAPASNPWATGTDLQDQDGGAGETTTSVTAAAAARANGSGGGGGGGGGGGKRGKKGKQVLYKFG